MACNFPQRFGNVRLRTAYHVDFILLYLLLFYRASIRRRAIYGRSEWLCGRSYHTPLSDLYRLFPTLTSSPTSSACAPLAEVTSRRKMAGGYTRTGLPAVRGRRTTLWRLAGAETTSKDRRSERLTCSYSDSMPVIVPSRKLPSEIVNWRHPVVLCRSLACIINYHDA